MLYTKHRHQKRKGSRCSFLLFVLKFQAGVSNVWHRQLRLEKEGQEDPTSTTSPLYPAAACCGKSTSLLEPVLPGGGTVQTKHFLPAKAWVPDCSVGRDPLLLKTSVPNCSPVQGQLPLPQDATEAAALCAGSKGSMGHRGPTPGLEFRAFTVKVGDPGNRFFSALWDANSYL